jgi:hypothetical protein
MKKLMAGVVALVIVAGVSIGVAKGVFGTGEPSDAAQAPVLAAEKKDEAAPAKKPSGPANQKTATALMDEAAKANKYLFGFFWKTENDQTTAMKKVFEDAIAKVSDRAAAAIVQVTDPAEEEIVKKFGLERAPMPLALAIAPNGAIMGGFPSEFTEEALVNAFGSRSTEKCMKSLQDGKLVFLCVQNASTTLNAEALQGVQDFKAEAQYAEVTEIVTLDPADSAEASFLGDLKIDPKTKVAVTAFLAPPGAVIAEFEGATKKDELIATLVKASSACGPGGSCGPGGCGPQ